MKSEDPHEPDGLGSGAHWTRRDFAQRVALGAAGLAAVGCGDPGKPSGRARPTPRGIVLITADDLGWKDLSSYGLTTARTPHLDRLVANGVAFANAFDVVSTCSSSRATFVTGQYPHTHGVTGLTHRHPELSLPASHPTLVRTLWEQGTVTAVQGKWHITAVDSPQDLAYDEHLPTEIDQWIRSADDALSFLDRAGDAPFYLELNFMQTHRNVLGDFQQADGFEVSPDDAVPPAWWGLPDWPEIREEVAGYLSHLQWMDALIGDLLAGMDARGLTEDTLVVFISDNGPAFPGCKLTLYDRGVGTPLAFHWPAVLEPRWEDGLVSSAMLAPTLLELAGAPALPDAEAPSMAGLLYGEGWEVDAVFAEMEMHTGEIPARSVRTKTHKYIRNYSDTPWGSGGGDGAWKELLADEPDQTWDEPRPPEELYDLAADPVERTNRIDDPALADVLADLRARLDAHMVETADPRQGPWPA